MSGAGGRRAKGLLTETTLADLEIAWGEREEEARALSQLGFHSTAAALRLYALEIQIKIAVCKHLGLPNLPSACKTHDLGELLVFTGRWRELQDAPHSPVRLNWDILLAYSQAKLNNLRYQPRAELDLADAAKIDQALDDPVGGVQAWLLKRP